MNRWITLGFFLVGVLAIGVFIWLAKREADKRAAENWKKKKPNAYVSERR